MSRILWVAALAATIGLSALAAVFGFNGWPPAAALAAPAPDCDSQAWKAAAAGLLEDLPGFKCKTLESGAVSGVNVRVVADAALNDPLVAEMAPQIMQAAQKALPKYKGYRPSLQLRNITFLIVSAPDRPDEAVANLGLADECTIFVFITKKVAALSPASRAIGTPFTAAHELVHCTQYWNFKPQMLVPFDERGWWSEATADYLASSVIDDKKGVSELAINFAYRSETNALTSMSYDAYPLFAWLGGVKGVANTYSFMAAMPIGGGIKAQRAALVAQAGGVEGLQGFATGFVEGTLKAPAGWALPKPELKTTPFAASGEKTFTTEPFTLMRGALTFQTGEFSLSAKTSTKPDARFKDGETAWGPAPPKVGSTCQGDTGLLYALFPIVEGKTTLTVKATKTGEDEGGEDKCEKKPPKPVAACQPLPQRDACLSGVWTVDGDKLTEMLDLALRKMGVYTAKDGSGWDGDGLLNFAANGLGVMTFKSFELDTHSRSPTAIHITTVNGSLSGGWSTSAGTMRYCPTANTVTIRTDVTLFMFANGKVNKIENSTTVTGGSEVQDFTYTCDAHTLMLKPKSGTTLEGAPLVWYYHR